MNAKEIVTKTFERSKFGGYRIEEVDEYLKDLSVEFKKLQNENEETEKKLEVLADKIKEYRADEDALRDALFIAKKNAIQIENEANENAEKTISEAKANAEQIETEAREKADKTIKDADALAQRRREMSEQALAEAKAQAAKLVEDAKTEAARIHLEMQQRTEREQIVLARVKEESDDYLRKILAAYNAHIEYIKSIPEQCENEFVIDTSSVVANRKPEESAFYVKPATANSVPVDAFAPMVEEEPEEEPEEQAEPEQEQPADNTDNSAEEDVITEQEITEEEPAEEAIEEEVITEEEPFAKEVTEHTIPTPVADVKPSFKTDSVLFSLGNKTKNDHRNNLEFGKNISGKKK